MAPEQSVRAVVLTLVGHTERCALIVFPGDSIRSGADGRNMTLGLGQTACQGKR
jgi:hypothetical protein